MTPSAPCDRIAIIDASPTERLFIQRMLVAAGYREILAFRSARQAFRHLGLEATSRSKLPEHINVILMDIHLPDMDGIEACERIKRTAYYQDVPILMITGKDNATFVKAAFEAGAMDYITKPVEKMELLARVRSALRLKRELDFRKYWENELTKIVQDVNCSLRKAETLRKLIPLCSSCKKIRNGRHSWQPLEHYVEAHSEIRFGSAVCPDCMPHEA